MDWDQPMLPGMPEDPFCWCIDGCPWCVVF